MKIISFLSAVSGKFGAIPGVLNLADASATSFQRVIADLFRKRSAKCELDEVNPILFGRLWVAVIDKYAVSTKQRAGRKQL